MKTVNADYGIDSVVAAERVPWYRWHRFSLLPILDVRQADQWNTRDFSFSWLNLRMWSMMSPELGAEIAIEDVGAYVKLRLPYLIIYVWFLWFPESWYQKLWRKPPGDLIDEEID